MNDSFSNQVKELTDHLFYSSIVSQIKWSQMWDSVFHNIFLYENIHMNSFSSATHTFKNFELIDADVYINKWKWPELTLMSFQ